jgi:hypothetical protein
MVVPQQEGTVNRRKSFVILALGTLVALLATSTVAMAQTSTATVTANAGARVIAAIGLAKTADLNFGSVIASATLAGTVVQTAVASPVRTGTNVTLGSATAVSPATFSVTGEGSATYAITLPSTPVTISAGINDMTITAFTSSPSGTGTLSAGGTQTLYVGGTLHIGQSQVAGAYTGTFDVTVTYN